MLTVSLLLVLAGAQLCCWSDSPALKAVRVTHTKMQMSARP